jgi:hypothetical protein
MKLLDVVRKDSDYNECAERELLACSIWCDSIMVLLIIF